jgi:PAS domain S-box-containing protein
MLPHADGEDRLRLILAATQAGMWDTHLGSGETYASDRFDEIMGYQPGGCPRKLSAFVRCVIPEHRARVLQLIRESVRTRTPYVVECRIRDARGDIKWLHVRGDVLTDAAGQATRIIGTVVDISAEATARLQQQAADERNRERERELARAQEIAQIGSWTWHFATESLNWSAEFYRIVGLDPREVAPSEAALDDLILPEDRARLRAAHALGIERGDPVDERYRIHRRDGTERHVHALTEVLYNDDGSPQSLIGTLQDVTERVRQDEERLRLEAQIHHAQKLESLGLLAGGIAHDFNNLLVGVLSNASLALLDLDESAPVRHVVLDIERTAQRAADLTRQLLAYSGKGRFVVEPLDLSAIASEMSQLLRTVVSKDATLHLTLDAAPPLMYGDATQLRQVIMNLITNASDALQGRAGSVIVRTSHGPHEAPLPDELTFGELRPGESALHLDVIDSGSGMERDVAERMFDPFFTTKFTGRGLGLAATLGIVRGHHGSISVMTAPGKGTHVRLSFPVANDAVQAPATAPGARPEASGGRVLVVDDDRVVRGVCAALLSRRGFTVESVECGRDALERLATSAEPYRFVLLDLTMPGLSGIEVLQRIREAESEQSRPAVPVFLMSGYSEQDVSSGLGELTISGFLQKPFTMNDVNVLLAKLSGQ